MKARLPQLSKRVLLDGAVGTTLIAEGLDPSTTPAERWNVDRPDVVRELHRRFVDAGADAIQTNTFGGNRLRLGAFGRGHEVRALNHAAAQLAREVAPPGVVVIGSLGPTGAIPPPEGNADLVELEEAYAEQAAALAEAGVDLLHVETMVHPKETRAALRGCRAGAPDLAVVASITCRRTSGGYVTTMGFSATSLIAVLLEEAADGLGTNCTLAPDDLLDLVQVLVDTGIPVFAKPTVAPDGRPPLYPEEFATGVEALFALGARAVGGCCGTGPADIAAARQRLDR